LCDPDYCAHTEDFNKKPDATSNLRTAGGHVHIGMEPSDMDSVILFVKVFDLFLTVPSILLDKDDRRREMYGKAGAFRFQPWGFECRSLSNFWLKSDESIGWVYDQIVKMFDFVNNSKHIGVDFNRIREAINTSNRDECEVICKEYNIL